MIYFAIVPILKGMDTFAIQHLSKHSISFNQLIIWFQLGMLWDAKLLGRDSANAEANIL
jgi:hypothetical protein